MGNSYKIRKVKSSMKKKGFEEENGGNHLKYYFQDENGNRTSIFTVMSHSWLELKDPYIGKISKELNFEDKNQFEKYIECTFSKIDYINVLKKKGILTRE